MDYDGLVDALDANGRLIVDAIEMGDPTAAVPTCPDFTLDRLAFHIGEFSSFWTHVVCEATSREKSTYPADPGPTGRAEWVDELIGRLVSELRRTAPDTSCWTWYEPDQSVAFVASRVCHELAIHRVDVQLAARGSADPVSGPVAEAGIEEVFLLLQESGVDGKRGTPGNGQTLALHATDTTNADWFIHLDPKKPRVSRTHVPVDLTIRASASDLEMLLYQRPTIGTVEWVGDRAVLDVFYGEFTFG